MSLYSHAPGLVQGITLLRHRHAEMTSPGRLRFPVSPHPRRFFTQGPRSKGSLFSALRIFLVVTLVLFRCCLDMEAGASCERVANETAWCFAVPIY